MRTYADVRWRTLTQVHALLANWDKASAAASKDKGSEAKNWLQVLTLLAY